MTGMSHKRKGDGHRRHYITSSDIPDRREHPVKYLLFTLKWRAAVATAAYPVQLALALAIAVCAVPVYMVIQNNNAVRDAVTSTHDGRVKSSREFCVTVNRTIAGVNGEATYLQKLVRQSAKQAQVFRPLYEKYGVTDAQRTKQSHDAVKGLEKVKVKPLNCDAIVNRIEGEAK